MEAAESEGRISCFLLGARIHDHVADMLHAVEEIDEAKAGEVLGDDARQWLDDLGHALAEERAQSRALGCDPPDVEQMLFDVVSTSVEGDYTILRERLYTLGVRLGDPPLLRNLRRAVQAAPHREAKGAA